MDIAELFVSATEKELELSSVVGVNPNISSSRLLSSNVDMPASVSTFGGFLNHSMLFIDVFMESPEAEAEVEDAAASAAAKRGSPSARRPT